MVDRIIFYASILSVVTVVTTAYEILSRPSSDSGFEEYITAFEKTYSVDVQSSINFSHELGHSTLGTCRLLPAIFGNRGGRIDINIFSWYELSQAQQVLLIWHELGHCEFRYAHTDDYLPDGCPKTLMHHYLIDPYCAAIHFPHYINHFSQGDEYERL